MVCGGGGGGCWVFFFGKGGGVEEGVKGVCDGGCVEAILFRSFFGSSVVLRYAVPCMGLFRYLSQEG